MTTPHINVRHVAKLARIALNESELAHYEAEISAILGYVAEIAQLPTDDIPVTAQVIASRDMLREDEVGDCLGRALFLAGAPAVQSGMVRVPRILAEVE